MVKAVVGANWGDEGKGKITDILAEDSDIVVRFQGGSNAGHNGLKYITQRLSTGDFWRLRVRIGHPRKLCPGMAVVDWVLGRATAEQNEGISKCLEGALKAVDNLALGKFDGAERTLGKFAHPPKPAKTEKTPEKKEPEAEA